MQIHRKDGSELWPVVFLGLLPFFFYFNWFSWFQTHFWTFGDGEYSYISYRKALIDAWSSFRLPIWNEYINLGIPLAGDPQVESFYPLNLLYLLLPFPIALNTLIMLHFSMAAVFTYLFLRETNQTRFASIIGGVVFAFCGAVNTRRGHISVQHTLVWLPLLLYAYERVTKNHSVRSICLLAVAFAAQFFAGFIQAWFYSALLLGAYMLIALPRYYSRKLWLKEITLFALVVISLIAGQLVMTFATAVSVKRTSIPFEVFTSYSFPIKHLRTLINPFFFGMTHPSTPFKLFTRGYSGGDNMSEFACYVGLLPLASILYIFLQRKRPRQATFWAIVGAAAILLSLGENIPWLARAVYQLPVLNSFRVPARFLFLFDFAAAVLAAMSLSAIDKASFNPRIFRWVVRGLFAFMLGTTSFSVRHKYLNTHNPELWVPVLVSFAFLALAELSPRLLLKRPGTFKIALALLVLADLWFFAFFNSNIFTPNNLDSRLAAVVRRLDPEGSYRILTVPGVNGDLSYDSLGHDRNMIHGIKALTGYTTFIPRTFMEALRADEGGGLYDFEYFVRNRNVISSFNTKWIIINNLERTDRRYKLLSERFAFMETFGNYDIFQNPEALPLVYGVSKSIHSPSYVIDGFNYRGTAIVDAGQIEESYPSRVVVQGIKQSTGDISATTQSEGKSLIIFAESYLRGWKGMVDGVPEKVIKVNGLLIGLKVPPGRHEIRVYFEPTHFYVAIAFSFLACIFVAAMFVSRLGLRILR